MSWLLLAPAPECSRSITLSCWRTILASPSAPRRWPPKSYELTSFLVDVLGLSEVEASYEGTVTYHDSCSSSRELYTRDAPRPLLASVTGLPPLELPESEICCG